MRSKMFGDRSPHGAAESHAALKNHLIEPKRAGLNPRAGTRKLHADVQR